MLFENQYTKEELTHAIRQYILEKARQNGPETLEESLLTSALSYLEEKSV